MLSDNNSAVLLSTRFQADPARTDGPTNPWFALRVRSNYERIAATHLRNRGFENFLPGFRAERQWSDRKKQVERFLFPGYVFCRVNLEDRLPVLTIPGA